MTTGTDLTVGVVGAGTMGHGIAHVAAWAGHRVILFDVADEPLRRGLAAMADFMQAGVERGKHSQDQVDAALQRVEGTVDLGDLSAAGLVIEAAPESLDLKRDLFGRLAEVLSANTMMASNTSTLSIASIFANVPHPERTLGMHFFNPAPLMPLVEVVRGPATAPEVAASALQLSREWGKHPVDVADTPGFIVNRVARPFYGEALRLSGERVASVADIDRLVRDGGFRMGPFELMDLIGIDVNYAAAKSVFEGFFGDPRFRPHPIQRAMVESGRLGRKTGRGYYDYERGRAEGGPAPVPRSTKVRRAMVLGETGEPLANDLKARLRSAGVEVLYDPGSFAAADEPVSGTIDAGFECSVVDAGARARNLERLERNLGADTPILACCHATNATTVAAGCQRPRRVTGFALVAPLADRLLVECARGLATDDEGARRADELWWAVGYEPVWIADSAGMVLPRIVSCLANEAAFALGEGTASADDIDRAMLLGTRYPRGPLAWASLIGVHQIVATMDGLASEHGEDRYRAAPALRRKVTAGLRRDVVW